MQRHVGGLGQIGGVRAVARRQGDADAHPGDDLVAVQQVWLGDGIDDALGERAGALRLLRSDLHDSEFVAAETRHGVAVAHAGRQALGDCPQQGVADRMSQRIVGALEVVEIEAEDRHLAVAAGAHQRILDPLAQQHAVGQVGQAVVVGHVGDLRLGLAAVGHVLMGRHPAAILQRLEDQADDSAVVKLDDVLERLAALDDVPQVIGVFVAIAAGVAAGEHPVFDDRLERRPRLGQLRRQAVDLRVAPIGDDQLLLRVEHDQADRHVVDRRVETLAVLLDFGGQRATAHKALAVAIGRIDERADFIVALAFPGDHHRSIAFIQPAHGLAHPADRRADVPADPEDGAEDATHRDGDRRNRQPEGRQEGAGDVLQRRRCFACRNR